LFHLLKAGFVMKDPVSLAAKLAESLSRPAKLSMPPPPPPVAAEESSSLNDRLDSKLDSLKMH
jgi:hypothetical protein